MKVSMKVISHL